MRIEDFYLHDPRQVFDSELSELEAELGMTAASQAERVQLWKAAAEWWIDALLPGDRVTADDLTRVIGLPDEGPNRNNVLGATFSAWAKTGRIRFTGDMRKSERVDRHVGLQRVWVKV